MKQLSFYSIPILKLLLFVVFLFLSAIPFGLIAQFELIKENSIHPLVFDIFSQAAVALITISALLMIFKLFKQYNFDHVFIVRENAVSGFLKGSLIGFVLISFCGILALFTGNVSFTLGKISFLVFFGYLVLYILVGIFEEFLFRSFPLLVLAERYPTSFSVFLTSLLFGIAHMGNAGFTALAMLNITLAGVLFALLILLKRNIYWAVGIHFGWNFTQGVILGYRVSGTEPAGILAAKPLGAAYLSGGSFGIEGSVFCTLLLVISIICMLRRERIRPIKEVQEIEEEF